MKRLSLIIALGLLVVAGCQKKQDDAFPDPVPVFFHVSSESEDADILYWAVFDSDGTPVEDGTTMTQEPGAFFNLTLSRNKAYKFAFWAQNSECTAYDRRKFASEGKVSVSYSGDANDESRDAFFGNLHDVIITEENESYYVELKRPLAQINFLAKDYLSVEDVSAHKTLRSDFTISCLPSVLNCLDGTTDGSAYVRFTSAPVIADAYVVKDSETYAVYAMNYVLASENKELRDVSVSFTHDLSDKPVTVTTHNMPFQRNWKTNVIGNFFIETASIDIVLMNGFNDDLEANEYEAL